MKTQNSPIVILIASFICMMFLSTARAADRPSDKVINFWVREALRADPRVNVSDVYAETRDGIVTLSGTAKSVAEKKYAVLESKKIQGVRGVVDRLEVVPSNRSDTDILQDVRQRIVFNSTIDSYGPYGVGVTVHSGEVTLTGEVKSWAECKEAELLASEVRGVKSVKNDLIVVHSSQRPDREIQLDIDAALNRDEYLAGLPISVSVNDGKVRLTGEVGNAYQKEQAGNDAYLLVNVKSVDNDIEVKWWKEDGTRGEIPLPSDEQLKQAVHDELYQDLRVNSLDITVGASYGHVTLRGTVPTYPQKQLAERDSREVVGVAWVSNLLSVRNDSSNDTRIRLDVETSINSDYSLNGQDIQVHVTDGVVTLTGNVNEYYEKYHATDVAGKVLGVCDVDNKIVVNSFPKYTDAALKRRITDRLSYNWETSWVAHQISVDVENGKVTLSGEVVTWAERDEAGRITALTDGVHSVDNQLIVANVDYPWGKSFDSRLYMP